MNGFIKLEVNDGHIEGEVHIERVSVVDKAILLDSFRQGLNMDNAEFAAVVSVILSGMLEPLHDNKVGVELDGDMLEMMKHIADGLKGGDE